MRNESRIYSFIDQSKSYVIHFLDGQKLIHDLAMIHSTQNESFSFFRDLVLSFSPLTNFLKPRESFGLYIDSNLPKFHFKIEMSESGHMRTLLHPSHLVQTSTNVTGTLRLSKILPGQIQPYNSLLQLENNSGEDAVKKVLKESYQLVSHLLLDNNSDQAALILKLPNIHIDKKEQAAPELSIDDIVKEASTLINKAFSLYDQSYDDLVHCFTSEMFEFLQSKEVKFQCSCSRDRMVQGVYSLVQSTGVDEIFQRESSIETKCDYCNTNYEISKIEIENLKKLSH